MRSKNKGVSAVWILMAAGVASPALAQSIAEPAKVAEDGPRAQSAAAPSREVETEAQQRLDEMVDAFKNASGVRFTAAFSVEGYAKDMIGGVEAKVVARREGSAWEFRLTGKGRRTPKNPEQEFDILYSGGNAQWLDHEAKKLLNKPASQARGKSLDTAGVTNLRSVNDLFAAKPLAKEMEARKISMKESETVGGVECDVLHFETGSASGDMTLWIGKADHWPRKITRENRSSERRSTMVLEFKDVVVGQSVSAEEMKIALPEGYTKEESAATKPATPPAGSGTPTALPTAKPITPADQNAPSTPIVMDDGRVILPGNTVPPPVNPGTPVLIDPSAESPPAEPESSGERSPATPVPAAESAHAEIHTLPEFELRDAKGNAVTAASLRGSHVVVIFGGSWSMSTRKLAPDLQSLCDRYAGKAKFVAVAVRQKSNEEIARLFEAAPGVTLALGGDKLAEDLRIAAFPGVIVVKPDGEFLLRAKTTRAADLVSEIKGALDAALGMTPEPAEPEAGTETGGGTISDR